MCAFDRAVSSACTPDGYPARLTPEQLGAERAEFNRGDVSAQERRDEGRRTVLDAFGGTGIILGCIVGAVAWWHGIKVLLGW